MSEAILLCKRETARLLGGISVRTVDYLVASRGLRARKIGRRVLFERRELEQFARRDHATQPEPFGLFQGWAAPGMSGFWRVAPWLVSCVFAGVSWPRLGPVCCYASVLLRFLLAVFPLARRSPELRGSAR